MKIERYSPAQQGSGEFDGGTITEQKPIGFPGEGSEVHRIGPLFYWAWAHAEKEGYIGSHPHQAFEILTYVIHGKAHHGDSLGTDSIVGPGGAQLIQAGSGVYHNERLVGPDAELFQIWFEPSLREALKREPAYRQFDHEDFTIVEQDGVTKKIIIGEEAPIQIVADARMWDIELQPGAVYTHSMLPERALAGLAIRGNGCFEVEGLQEGPQAFQKKDFVVVSSEQTHGRVLIKSDGIEPLRMTLIEVPTKVDYPLYPKRH